MSKVVINKKYGGYGISSKAKHLYWELKQQEDPTFDIKKRPYPKRDDPTFIRVVEQLGNEASKDKYAKLCVETLPEDIKSDWLVIDTYDGYESVRVDYGKGMFLIVEEAIKNQTPPEQVMQELKNVYFTHQKHAQSDQKYYQRGVSEGVYH